ncbi:MAG TPA: four helix bundle protein [Chitinophagaceae bacterium]
MATFRSYTELDLWQRARALENKIFNLTKNGSLAKDYGLKDQMNRSTGAIMDNIAEGFGRGSKLEFIQFLTISRGSAAELQSQLYRCLDRGYIEKELVEQLIEDCEDISKMITSFIAYLNKSEFKGQKFKSRTT